MRRSPLQLAGLVLALACLLALVLWALRGEDAPAADAVRRDAEEPSEPPPAVLVGRGVEDGDLVDVEEAPEGEPADEKDVPGDTYVVEGVVRLAGNGEPCPFQRVVASWYELDVEKQSLRRHHVDAETDAEGLFRLEAAGPGPSDFGLGPGLQVLRWHVVGDEESRLIAIEPGAVTKVVLWAWKTFRLQGVVEDERGRPLDGVQVEYTVPQLEGPNLMLFSSRPSTSGGGRFDIGPFPEDPRDGLSEERLAGLDSSLAIYFRQDGYATLRLDPWSVDPTERDRLTVCMTRGHALAGVLVDDAGRPLGDAVVAAEYGDVYQLRRATRTDANGRWRLDALTPGPMTLLARAFADDAKARREMTLAADDLDVRLVAETIRLSRPPVTYPVLGLQLVDVDDEIRAAYDVPEHVKVMIFDPGDDPARLGIGRLERGYGLWHVGRDPVESVRDAIQRLLDGTKTKPGFFVRVRVVYTFWDERMRGTNTQHVRVTEEDREALGALLERLQR